MNLRRSLGGLLMLLIAVSVFGQKGPSQYNLKVGDKFTVTATIKQEIEQTMLGQAMETIQNITTVDEYEVVSVSGQGIKMKTTGLSRSIYTETAGGSVSMDSDMEGDEHLAFRVLTGKSYYVEMNKYGRFLRFSGLDEMGREVERELEGTLLEGSADDLMSAYNEESLGTAFDGQFYIYKEPGKPWNRDAQMTVNNLPISVSYDFSRYSANEIRATGVMVLSGEFEVMGNMMEADMAGDQTSSFKLDPKTGLAMTIITDQDMDGSLEISDITVPMVLKTRVEVEVTR